jgi:hypothetical protein
VDNFSLQFAEDVVEVRSVRDKGNQLPIVLAHRLPIEPTHVGVVVEVPLEPPGFVEHLHPFESGFTIA